MIKEDLQTPFLEQVHDILNPLQEGRAFFEYQRHLTLATEWNDKAFRLKQTCFELLKQIDQIQTRYNQDPIHPCI